jgi:hypothetical protein
LCRNSPQPGWSQCRRRRRARLGNRHGSCPTAVAESSMA